MSRTYGEQGFMSYMSYQEQAQELSASKYNLVLGATLTWGFGLNYLMMSLLGSSILNVVYGSGFLPFLILYFLLVMVGSSMVRSFDPIRCFIGYNLIAVPVGMVALSATMLYDPSIVMRAVLATAIITLIMMILSTIHARAFSRMAPTLAIALVSTLIVESLMLLLFRQSASMIDWIVVTLMSLYIGYDWVRANSVQRTTANAIAAASALYLDIINIFLRLLRIFARSRRSD